jgi:hypothetical protein
LNIAVRCIACVVRRGRDKRGWRCSRLRSERSRNGLLPTIRSRSSGPASIFCNGKDSLCRWKIELSGSGSRDAVGAHLSFPDQNARERSETSSTLRNFAIAETRATRQHSVPFSYWAAVLFRLRCSINRRRGCPSSKTLSQLAEDFEHENRFVRNPDWKGISQ